MLHSIIGSQMTVPVFLICIFLAAVVGLGTAFLFSFKSRHTASMFLTLSIMPAAIALVIMLVNGNIGAGVAVAGAFALVRFRSVPGTAREIAAIFVDMALGLAFGMGQVALGLISFAFWAGLVLVLTLTGLGDRSSEHRQLKITIPENLDYNELFDDLLEEYTVKSELIQVKTTNMGTLYELCYDVVLKDEEQTKEFLDELRCRNGNLSIALGRITDNGAL